jgi:putative endonuclease
MGKTYYVYIITNERNTVLYIGITNDLVRRIHEHRNGAVDGFSKRYNAKKLAYFENTGSVMAAMEREKELKKWKRCWKMDLIKKSNPDFADLYDDICL